MSELRQREGDQPLPTQAPLSEPVLPVVTRKVIAHGIALDYKESLLRDICADIKERTDLGVQRYGTPLHTFNGRVAARDLYEELVDATQYAVQQYMEESSKHRKPSVDTTLLVTQLLTALFAAKELLNREGQP